MCSKSGKRLIAMSLVAFSFTGTRRAVQSDSVHALCAPWNSLQYR